MGQDNSEHTPNAAPPGNIYPPQYQYQYQYPQPQYPPPQPIYPPPPAPAPYPTYPPQSAILVPTYAPNHLEAGHLLHDQEEHVVPGTPSLYKSQIYHSVHDLND